jgi:hypothetical protein
LAAEATKVEVVLDVVIVDFTEELVPPKVAVP